MPPQRVHNARFVGNRDTAVSHIGLVHAAPLSGRTAQVGEVCDGQAATNRANSIKVGRAKGFVVYLADSETEQVEWLSALETTVTRLVKIIAGIDDEAAPAGTGGAGSRSAAAMLQQAERDFAATRPRGPSRSGSQGARQFDSGDSGGYGGSARYPGVEAPRMGGRMPQVGGVGGEGSVYRDELGVQYGLGSGTTIDGVAGVGGVRNAGGAFGGVGQGGGGGGGSSGFSGASSYSGYAPSLPATVNVADTSFAPHEGAPPSSMHGGPHHGPPGPQPHYGAPAPRHQWAPALPDTLDVVSIIDQPPAQTTSYGIGSAAQGAPQHAQWGGAPPQHQPAMPAPPRQPAPQWQTHYTPEGRPYYFDPATGQSVWDPPC